VLESDLAALEQEIDDARSATTEAPAPTLPPTTVAPATTSPPTTRAVPPPTAAPTFPPAAPPSPGVWITVLASMDDDDPAAADARLSSLRASYGSVAWLDSDGYPSLGPGYFVLYVGPYSSGGEAVGECYSLGLPTRGDCYAAPLTQSSADRSSRLYPD